MRRHWFVGLSLLSVALTAVLGVLLWYSAERYSLSAVSEQIQWLKPLAGATRLLLIGLLAAIWPRLVDLAVQYGQVDTTARPRLVALRWRVVVWLLIIELLIGQDLINRFLQAAGGPVA
ncbi:MAG: hypothetical protein KDI49_07130 [Gammaproteobacteria bacterium]|nr:hypothetical protein [Gammaproteobacteria bacterium]